MGSHHRLEFPPGQPPLWTIARATRLNWRRVISSMGGSLNLRRRLVKFLWARRWGVGWAISCKLPELPHFHWEKWQSDMDSNHE